MAQKSQNHHKKSQSEAYENGRRHAFALALAEGCSIKLAAQKVLYDYDYARKLARRPNIRRLVEALRERFVDEAAGLACALNQDFFAGIKELISQDAPPQVRLGAIRLGLETMLELRSVTESEKKLRILQKKYKDLTVGNLATGDEETF